MEHNQGVLGQLENQTLQLDSQQTLVEVDRLTHSKRRQPTSCNQSSVSLSSYVQSVKMSDHELRSIRDE